MRGHEHRSASASSRHRSSVALAGTPYSAIPAVKDGRSLVVVLFALPDGKTNAVNVDLL
jgi:hypothetical protein